MGVSFLVVVNKFDVGCTDDNLVALIGERPWGGRGNFEKLCRRFAAKETADLFYDISRSLSEAVHPSWGLVHSYLTFDADWNHAGLIGPVRRVTRASWSGRWRYQDSGNSTHWSSAETDSRTSKRSSESASAPDFLLICERAINNRRCSPLSTTTGTDACRVAVTQSFTELEDNA
jgi:hypothetical protein